MKWSSNGWLILQDNQWICPWWDRRFLMDARDGYTNVLETRRDIMSCTVNILSREKTVFISFATFRRAFWLSKDRFLV
jgi:hypothetical protein